MPPFNNERTPEVRSELEMPPTIVDLTEMGEATKEELARAVEKSHGTIRVFVHPFFGLHNKPLPGIELSPDHLRRRERALAGIDTVLKSESEFVPPIILLEEEARLADVPTELEYLSRTIYVIPTHEKSPEPFWIDKNIGSYGAKPGIEELTEREKANWAKTMDLFEEVGVRKILVGGSFLQVYRIPQEDGIKLQRCVGGTIRALSTRFQVELSFLTYPHNREDLKAAERGEHPAEPFVNNIPYV